MPQPTVVKVGRHNQSAAITLPKEFCKAMEVDRGDYIIVSMPEPGIVVITKASNDPRLVEVIK
jgi:hypothetical protein